MVSVCACPVSSAPVLMAFGATCWRLASGGPALREYPESSRAIDSVALRIAYLRFLEADFWAALPTVVQLPYCPSFRNCPAQELSRENTLSLTN
jgi:hypothetical protein